MKALNIFVIIVLILLAGCARMQRVESGVISTQAKVEKLEANLDTLTQAIDDLNINQGGATRKMKADLTMLLKELMSQLDRLNAEMDESQYRLKQMENKIAALSSQRLLMTDGASDSTAGDSTAPKTGGKKVIIPGLDIEKLYHQAREDYIIGKYDLAFKGFRIVLEKDKTGSYKDNALYWMGECFYKQKKYDEAIEYYSRCINEYPHGNKICSAIFKIGLISHQKKDFTERDNTWKRLAETSPCPNSNEAHRAEEMMKK